jgi:hypothetical protein
MPAIECQNCQTLIEYWPRRGSFQVSCVRCKRLTTVSGGATVPERTARASKPYRPPIKAPPKWVNARRSHSYSFQVKLFAAKVGDLARTVVAYTIAVSLLAGLVFAVKSVAHSNKLKESTGITLDNARKRILDSASNLDDALAIQGNEPFRAWLEKPCERLALPRAASVALTMEWGDDHDSIDVVNGVRYQSNRPVAQFRINRQIDGALAEAIERQFGRPSDYTPPASVYFTHDNSRPLLNAAQAKKMAEIEQAHGFVNEASTLKIDHRFLVQHSMNECQGVAESVVRAVCQIPVLRATPRERVEAITSFVQNAIQYTPNVEDEQIARFHDGTERFGIRPPLSTLIRGGDCDSKSLLLLTMIRALDPNVPLAIISVHDSDFPHDPSSDTNHAIAGVAIAPKPGERTLRQGNVTYVLIESTYDWDVGRLSASTQLDTANVNPIP